MSEFSVTLELPHPPATLFRFLADPHNRSSWQSSLKTVVDVDDGEPRVGMRWRDVTKVGIRPLGLSATYQSSFCTRLVSEIGVTL